MHSKLNCISILLTFSSLIVSCTSRSFHSETKQINGTIVNASDPVSRSTVAIVFTNPAAMGPKIRVQTVCTGTLISENWVVTAAHCVLGSQPPFSTLRIAFLQDVPKAQQEGTLEGALRGVDRVVVHNANRIASMCSNDQDPVNFAECNARSEPPTPFYDLALIRFKDKFANGHQPARLPEPNLKMDGKSTLVTAGYGLKKDQNEDSKRVTGVLTKIESSQFQADWSHSQEFLVQNTEAAGNCHGDSGGPIYLSTAHEVLTLVGVTSRGDTVCGVKNGPVVYSDLRQHLNWVACNAGLKKEACIEETNQTKRLF